jgi:hypothetical protein
VLAWVLVPAKAAAITNVDIRNFAAPAKLSSSLKPPIGPWGVPTARATGAEFECDPLRDTEVFLVLEWAQEEDRAQIEVDGKPLPTIEVKGKGFGEALLVIPNSSHTFIVPAGKKWKINMLAGAVIAESSYCPV